MTEKKFLKFYVRKNLLRTPNSLSQGKKSYYGILTTMRSHKPLFERGSRSHLRLLCECDAFPSDV